MKILFVQKVKALVGSEKYFLELIPELEKRGIETEFACIYARPDKEKTLPFINAYNALGLKLHVLEIDSEKSILKCLRFLDRIVNKGNFNLVHSHLIHADFWCAVLKKTRRIKCPLVSTKHGYEEIYLAKYGFSVAHLKRNRYYRICRFSEKYIDHSFAVSEGLRNFFIDAGISAEKNITTIHHGFDLPECKQAINPSFRFSPNQLVVLGRVIPFKGHRYLFESLVEVKKEINAFKLLVLGHGDEELIKELTHYAIENGISENVEFLGYKSNIYDYLVNSDLMIVPSVAEGFGLIFLEAMNAKIPLIGFDVPATNEILINDKTGILIPPYNTREMGKSIIRLLNERETAHQFADEGYKRLKDYFSLDRMVSQTILFYHSALNSPDSSRRSE